MAYIILVVLLTIALALAMLYGPEAAEAMVSPSSVDARGRARKHARKIALTAYLSIFLLLTLLFSVHRVSNGHVGLVYTFGGITGQRGHGQGGLVVTAPWQNVKQANVQIQAVSPITSCSNGQKGCLEAFTSETQDTFVSVTVNFHVDAQNIQPLYRTVGPDYVNKLILPRVAQIAKEEAVKYSASDIAPHREDLRKTIAQRLTSDLSQRGIIIDDFLLTNLDFSQQFKASIEAKVKAEQDAQAEKNKVAIAQAQAQQVAAQAQGEADKLRIEAQGQADANRAIAASLTPELIQFQALQKLNPNVQIALVPSGAGLLIDPSTLLQQSPAR